MSPTQHPVTATSTEATCPTCHDKYDARNARWCECIDRERTAVCSKCNTCLCRLTATQRSEFWKRAPEVLWAEKLRRLRAERSTAAAPAPARVEPAGDSKTPLVLLADDSRLMRMAVRQALQTVDCRFLEAADGLEALALARQNKPAIIISDALMPKLDGRQMCEAVKNDPALAHTRVVIMSGLYTAQRYHTEARRSFGVDEYLSKPIDIEKLRSTILRFLAEPAAAMPMATAAVV